MAAVLVRWAMRWARVRAVVRAASPLSWPAAMPVLTSPSLLEPGLVGLWRPVLVVPETLPDHLSRPEIAAIVAHEACHLRRRDNLTAAVHMLVEALVWFHPLVWWIGARLIEERERACDEAVVQGGHDPAAYARSLVESCRLYLQSPLSCVAGASGSNLKRRVETIMTVPPSPPLSLPGKALLAAAGACAFASPVAAGWLASPAGHAVAARAAVVAARYAPARIGAGAFDPASAGDAGGAGKAPEAAANEASPTAGRSLALVDSASKLSVRQADGAPLEPAKPLPPVAGVDSRITPIDYDTGAPAAEANGSLGPGHYVEVSGMQKTGRCAAWSSWYVVSTRPVAPGYAIQNFRYALRGDRDCLTKFSEQARAQCEVLADAPDRKTVRFRMQGNGDQCFATSGQWPPGGAQVPGGPPLPHTASDRGQGEMVMTYDVVPTDQRSDAGCYIAFGELHCSRIDVRPSTDRAPARLAALPVTQR